MRPHHRAGLAGIVLLALIAAACGSDGRQYDLPAPVDLAPVQVTGTTIALPLVEAGPNAMTISSPAFSSGAVLPTRFSITAENLSPSLSFTSVPIDTVEYAVLVRDPDRPFVHWLVTGIPGDTPSIGEGGVPSEAIEHANDAAEFGWFGPDVAEGATGRLQFELFVFSTAPKIDDAMNQAEVIDLVQSTNDGRAAFVVRYGDS